MASRRVVALRLHLCTRTTAHTLHYNTTFTPGRLPVNITSCTKAVLFPFAIVTSLNPWTTDAHGPDRPQVCCGITLYSSFELVHMSAWRVCGARVFLQHITANMCCIFQPPQEHLDQAHMVMVCTHPFPPPYAPQGTLRRNRHGFLC